MDVVLERRRDSEVSAAAANAPEQVGIIIRTRGDDPAIGENKLD